MHGLTIVTMFFGFICSKTMVHFRKGIECQKSLRLHQKHLNLCSQDEQSLTGLE